MDFASFKFFAIVSATIVGYFIWPKKTRWLWLLATSCAFYVVASGVKAFIMAVATIAIAYGAALWIEKASDDRKKKRLYLSAGIIVLLGILVVTKIAKLAFQDISWIIVPLGVSYYTLSLIGYLLDVYSRKQAAEHNPLKLFLYALYFPKIMQGPFSKYMVIGPKLLEPHTFSYYRLVSGLERIAWGFFKKLVIVERAAFLTNNVFNGNLADYKSGGAVLLVTTFIATIKHYCDFSGYMDIVVGISEILGIELDENFRQPFFSKSAAEFWRRWHISLGAWFKDYVYMFVVISPKVINLSKWFRNRFGKRAGKNVLSVVPLAVVWLLTGLWHGNGIDYLLWGVYWGLIMIISTLLEPELKKLREGLHIKAEARWWKTVQMVRTFCIFVFGLLISTFVGFAQLGTYFNHIFTNFNLKRLTFKTFENLGMNYTNLMIILGATVILWIVDALGTRGSVRKQISKIPAVLRWTVWALLLLCLIMLGIYGPGYTTSGFVYTHF